MLIELWERLHGYDKWVQTQARVKSANERKTEEYYKGQKYDVWSSDDEIVWTDEQGEEHTAEIGVPEDSPLFQMIGGETVTIRYDPKDPGNFFYPDLLRSKATVFARGMKVLLVFGLGVGIPYAIFLWAFGSKR